MDATLHCNDIKCRTVCDDRAVTTTCCHIFCLPCADRLGLTAARDGQRKCPACGATLNNPDDAAIAQLNPSEDYKSSILAGLNPTIIVEIAGRGLAFWNYQMTQEVTYQEYLGKSLTNKYHSLSANLDTTIKNANDEIKGLETRLQDAHDQLNDIYGKHEKLIESYKEKSRSQATFEKLYNSLKQQQIAAGLESAAERNADSALYDASSIRHHGRKKYGNAGSPGSRSSDKRRGQVHATNSWHNDPVADTHRVGVQSSHSLHLGNATRTRLPQATFGSFNPTLGGIGPRVINEPESLRQGTPIRGAFDNIVNSTARQFGGSYGFTGAKVSRPPQDVLSSRAKTFGSRQAETPGLHIR